MHLTALTTIALSAAVVSGADIHVEVGKTGFTFEPNDFSAEVGDNIIFKFNPLNHAVAVSSFNKPCVPIDQGGFFSGFMPTSSGPANNTFQYTVTSKDPMWIYCPQTNGKHCQNGMVGVINVNANSNKTLAAYKAAAAKTSDSEAPAQAFGGKLVPLSSADSTSSAATSAATSAAKTSAATSSGAAKATGAPGNQTTSPGGSHPNGAASSLPGMAGVVAAMGVAVAFL